MNRISDWQRVIEVYRLAGLDRNRAQVSKPFSIYVGKPDDGGRQISDQCATPQQAWRSAWERIEAARKASHVCPVCARKGCRCVYFEADYDAAHKALVAGADGVPAQRDGGEK